MKFVRLLVAVLISSALGASVLAYWGWYDIHRPVEHHALQRVIEIPRGASPDETVNRLVAVGIVKHSWPLRIYIRLKGAGQRMKAGDYLFPSPISPCRVLDQLEEGGNGAAKLTVIEGWNRWDIASAMTRIPSLKLTDTQQALKLMSNTGLIKDLDPSAGSLEGYMYPETYYVLLKSTPEDLIVSMVRQFRAVWSARLSKKAARAHRSVHEVVTMASIVETEAKLKEERPIIASVIVNRLNRNMTLSMDSTIVYASKLAGRWRNDGKVYRSDIDRDSPYNTRKYFGLPPGPVGSPGLASLNAATEPAHTDFLYYVRNPARNDGAHNFYTNAADFDRGVQALRDWEKEHNR